MKTIQDLLALWDPLSSLAREINELPDTVKKWKHRGAIPPRCWADVAAAARGKKHSLTVADLMRLHSKPPLERGRKRKSALN